MTFSMSTVQFSEFILFGGKQIILHFSRSLQYVAQFPATLVCNRYNFLNMHGKHFSFLSNKVHLLTFKMYKGWLPSSSIKGIMPFLAKLVRCPVSGQLVQFPAIEIKNIFLEAARL